MFNKTSLVSVSLALPSKANKEFDSLILNGIRISLGDGLYSEIEEQSCFALNKNDYGVGLVEFELQFEPIKEPYCPFWIGCTSIRTERKIYKLDPPLSSFKTNFDQTCQTKITYENKMAATITYFFESEEDKADFLQSRAFLIEGFIALKKQDNVFGFLCKVERDDQECKWNFTEGYTNRPLKKATIAQFIH